jgi:hypothetical protein
MYGRIWNSTSSIRAVTLAAHHEHTKIIPKGVPIVVTDEEGSRVLGF